MRPKQFKTPLFPAQRQVIPGRPINNPEKLPRWFIDKVQPAIEKVSPDTNVDLEAVKIHQGIPKSLRRMSFLKNPAAVTVGYDIYCSPGECNLKRPEGWETVIHEIKHIDQYKDEGPVMYQKYQETGTYDNPYEQEAYDFQHKVMNALRRKGILRT